MRYLSSLAAGIGIAILLFLMMSALIARTANRGVGRQEAQLTEFVRIKEDEIVNLKQRVVPPKPPPPKEPPPPPRLKLAKQDKPPPAPLDIETPDIELSAAGAGPYLGTWRAGDPAAEGDVIPIVTIGAQYPRDALLEGIEGWVRFEFTVMEDGSVADLKLLDSKPPRVFDRAARRAMLKWKFKPRIVNGQAVRRPGATWTMQFTFDDE